MGNLELADINTRLVGIGDSIATTKASLVILDKELGTDKQECDKAVGVALPLAIAKLRQLHLNLVALQRYCPSQFYAYRDCLKSQNEIYLSY